MTTTLHHPSRLLATPDTGGDAASDRRAAQARARLRTAHLAAADCVDALDLDDRRLWTRAAPWVAALTRAAYEVSAVIRSESPVRAASCVPPVVRTRELAQAQDRLFADLRRDAGPPVEVLEASAGRVARLAERIETCRLLS